MLLSTSRILSHLIHSPYSLLPNDVLSLSPQILHPLLLAQLRLLSLSTPSLLPSSILCLNAVRSLFTSPHPDPATRFLAIRVYSLSTDVAESKRSEWEEQCLDGRKLGEGELAWFEGVSVGPEEGDVEERWSNAWVWPLIEQQRLVNFNAWLSDLDELYTPSNFTLSPIPLPSHLVLVADRVLLFRPPPAPLSMSTTNPALIPHVSTTSSTSTLLSLALHLSTRLPILLTSPPSAGKTHLITYLSHLLFPHAVNRTLVISLADTSLDPKSLLGNYVSSPTDPGKFVWVQGALAKAVQEGRWVVLEDIDKAGSEVLALVGGLAESMGRSTRKIGDRGSLKIPGRDDVLIGEGFALFATRTTQPYSRSPISSETHIDVAPTLEWPKPSFLNAQKFQEVHLPSPTREEIRLILEKRFDVLAGAGAGKEVDRLMTAWETARKVGAGGGAGVGGMSVKGRDVGLRDLIKWFGRIESLLSAYVHRFFLSLLGSRAVIVSLVRTFTFCLSRYLQCRPIPTLLTRRWVHHQPRHSRGGLHRGVRRLLRLSTQVLDFLGEGGRCGVGVER
jgi:midasin